METDLPTRWPTEPDAVQIPVIDIAPYVDGNAHAVVASRVAHACEETGFWLTTPRNALDGEESLTLLARGQRDRVVDAAEGHLQRDFA